MRKGVAIGLVSTAVIAGCGEQARPDYPGQAQVQADIRYLQQPDVQGTADLSKLTPARFRQVAKFSMMVANKQHDGALYSELPPSPALTRTAQFYGGVQRHLFDVATRYPTIGLPLGEDSNAKTVGRVVASLRFTTDPSAVVATARGTISTYTQTYAKGLAAAATFKPTPTNKLHETISVIAASSTYLADTESLATEACQAALDVTTPDKSNQLAAQEVVCNTFGYAYGYAINRYSYSQYREATDTNTHAMGTTDGHFFRYMVLPPAAYAQIQHNESPTALAGIRTEQNVTGE